MNPDPTNWTLIWTATGVFVGFVSVILTILKTSRTNSDNVTKQLNQIHTRVEVIDSHTSGTAAKFVRVESKIEALQAASNKHTGQLEYQKEQIAKLERRMDAMQERK